MDVRQPFAVIVTTSDTDLKGAVLLAAETRSAGAVVETPLAHTQVKPQMRRALAAEPKYVVVLDGDMAEIVNVQTGRRTASPAAEASTSLADLYGYRLMEGQQAVADRIVPIGRGAFASLGRQTGLPRAA